MDFMHRQQDDFCSVRGFVLSIRDTLRVKKGGMLWCGHPCGPFLANTIVGAGHIKSPTVFPCQFRMPVPWAGECHDPTPG